METENVKANPLKTPKILEKILDCLPMKDLKESRFVNKMWRDCGIDPMKRKEENAVRLRHHHEMQIEKFVACLDSVAGGSNNFPSSKVFVDMSFIGWNKDELAFSTCMKKISPWLMELQLKVDMGKIKIGNAFPLIMAINFPKLEVLELRTYGMKTRGSVGNFYEFVINILEKASCLRKVDFDASDDSIDAIIKARKPSFTELRIDGHISHNCLEKLSRWAGMPKLKSLDLTFSFEVSNANLFKVLSNQKNSLETLALHFFYISSPIMVTFPVMPKLKNLTILLTNDHDEDEEDERKDEIVKFPGISYQQQFPSLKTLHLNPQNLEATPLCKYFIKQEMSPFETLEELTFPRGESSDESLLMTRNAVQIFPNLKKLNVAPAPSMLPTIFEHCTNLEELTFRYKAVPESFYQPVNRLLMGLAFPEYHALEKRFQNKGNRFVWNRVAPGKVKESIVNLQKLRVLRFDNGMGSQKMEIGKLPLYLILSGIPSLRCLDFGERDGPIETEVKNSWWAKLNEDCAVLWNQVQH